jgi:opacity protein-like surface antigen
MGSHRLVVAVLFVAIGLPALASAQAQSYGDGFGVGGVLLPDSSQALLGKARLGDTIGIELSLALASYSDGDSDTDFTIGAAVQKFWNVQRQVQPYVGGRVSINQGSHSHGSRSDDDDVKLGLAGVIGAEYFVVRNFSIEAEFGVGAYIGSFSIGTETRLAALLYL